MNTKTITMAALSLGVIFVSCKKDEPPPPPKVVEAPKPPPPPPPPPKPPEPAAVSGVTLGKAIGSDGAVTAATEKFGVKDATVYASIATTGEGTAVRLKATFFYMGKKEQMVGEAMERMVDLKGPASTEFHVEKKSGWPKGKYRVDVELNGEKVSSKEYTVE